MPEISRFLGIVIAMYYNDHAPPHFHARYGESEIRVDIETGSIMSGFFQNEPGNTCLNGWIYIGWSLWKTGSSPNRESPCARSSLWSSIVTPRLKSVKHVGGYRLKLAFEDGRKGEVDLENQLWGEVFEPLRDVEQFKRFRIDDELQTIVWPTGADLAPEYLYEACA